MSRPSPKKQRLRDTQLGNLLDALIELNRMGIIGDVDAWRATIRVLTDDRFGLWATRYEE